MNYCKCGCGQLCNSNYKRGCGRKGKKNSIAHNLAIGNANRGRKGQIPWNIGLIGAYSATEETKRKLSAVAKERGFGKWMKDKKLSEETCKRMSASRMGHTVPEETCKKISLANSGENNGCFGRFYSQEEREAMSAHSKKAWKNPITRAKIMAYKNSDKGKADSRKAALKTAEKLKHMWFHNTKPELEMLDILEELNLEFIHTYSIWDIEHCYAADFYLPEDKIVIEVDGKYWHNYPIGTNMDLIRAKELAAAGYKLIRFWENEFDKEKVVEEIEKC